jgi:hypothetical protein
VTTSPSPTTSPTPQFSAAASWTFTLTGDNGDTTNVSLEADRFSSIDKAPPLPSGETAAALSCTIDRERDVVAPVVLRLSNANAQLSQRLYVSFNAIDDRDPSGDDAVLDYAAFFSDGPQCGSITRFGYFGGQSSLDVASADGVSPGNNVRVEFYLILHNFITANEPEGDESILRNIALVLYLGRTTDHGPRQVSRLTGPKGGTYLLGWPRLPLAPLAPAGIIVARQFAQVTDLHCDESYKLKGKGGRRIKVEAVGSGGSAKWLVLGTNGQALVGFSTVWGRRTSASFIMPANGQATVQGYGKDNFVTGCTASLAFFDTEGTQ